jgi:hypothetical protein
MALLETTQILLDRAVSAGFTHREIADASGGKVQLEWLRKFARGDIDNPGVLNIQSLHDCLKSLKPKRAA